MDPEGRSEEDKKKEAEGYWEPYAYFARAVRLWFLAYGVGFPIAIISNEWLLKRLRASGCLATVAWLFIAGVVVQVLAAMFWRTSMWYQYLGEPRGPKVRRRRAWMFRASRWVSEQYWIELIPDIATLVLFARATATALRVICSD